MAGASSGTMSALFTDVQGIEPIVSPENVLPMMHRLRQGLEPEPAAAGHPSIHPAVYQNHRMITDAMKTGAPLILSQIARSKLMTNNKADDSEILSRRHFHFCICSCRHVHANSLQVHPFS